jgi:hypothetical protein
MTSLSNHSASGPEPKGQLTRIIHERRAPANNAPETGRSATDGFDAALARLAQG